MVFFRLIDRKSVKMAFILMILIIVIIFIIYSSCQFFGCIDRCDCKKKENQTRTINVEEVP